MDTSIFLNFVLAGLLIVTQGAFLYSNRMLRAAHDREREWKKLCDTEHGLVDQWKHVSEQWKETAQKALAALEAYK